MEEQITMFDLLEPVKMETRFEHELKRGSGIEDGKVRIYAAAINLDNKELADFLKKEYGIGGHSTTFPDGKTGFTDYNTSGILMREWKSDKVEKHNWNECAKEVRRLIIRGEYLNEKEFAKVQEVANANEGRLPHPVPRCAWAYEVTG
jgi:hypothetical protein